MGEHFDPDAEMSLRTLLEAPAGPPHGVWERALWAFVRQVDATLSEGWAEDLHESPGTGIPHEVSQQEQMVTAPDPSEASWSAPTAWDGPTEPPPGLLDADL